MDHKRTAVHVHKTRGKEKNAQKRICDSGISYGKIYYKYMYIHSQSIIPIIQHILLQYWNLSIDASYRRAADVQWTSYNKQKMKKKTRKIEKKMGV